MQPAKFHFKNIGPISKAKLELGDLTIIAGRNNTGKSYIAYTLYGFLSQWNRLPWDMGMGLKRITAGIIEKGRFERTVNQETLDRERKEWLNYLTRSFSQEEYLADIFSSSRNVFSEASIEVELPYEFFKDVEQVKTTLETGDLFSVQYDGTNIVVTGKNIKSQHRHSGEFVYYISTLYRHFLFPELPTDTIIFSTERSAISLFYKELDFTKNKLVDLLQRISDKEDRERFSPYAFIDRITSRYTLPIKDNIDYTRDISNLERQRSDLYESKLFDKIKDMMEGYYKSYRDDIRFISKRKGRNFNIPLHMASSSAREICGFNL